jgi:hypothetical protein
MPFKCGRPVLQAFSVDRDGVIAVPCEDKQFCQLFAGLDVVRRQVHALLQFFDGSLRVVRPRLDPGNGLRVFAVLDRVEICHFRRANTVPILRRPTVGIGESEVRRRSLPAI